MMKEVREDKKDEDTVIPHRDVAERSTCGGEHVADEGFGETRNTR